MSGSHKSVRPAAVLSALLRAVAADRAADDAARVLHEADERLPAGDQQPQREHEIDRGEQVEELDLRDGQVEDIPQREELEDHLREEEDEQHDRLAHVDLEVDDQRDREQRLGGRDPDLRSLFRVEGERAVLPQRDGVDDHERPDQQRPLVQLRGDERVEPRRRSRLPHQHDDDDEFGRLRGQRCDPLDHEEGGDADGLAHQFEAVGERLDGGEDDEPREREEADHRQRAVGVGDLPQHRRHADVFDLLLGLAPEHDADVEDVEPDEERHVEDVDPAAQRHEERPERRRQQEGDLEADVAVERDGVFQEARAVLHRGVAVGARAEHREQRDARPADPDEDAVGAGHVRDREVAGLDALGRAGEHAGLPGVEGVDGVLRRDREHREHGDRERPGDVLLGGLGAPRQEERGAEDPHPGDGDGQPGGEPLRRARQPAPQPRGGQ